ncbi:MAG: hypothetical protein ACI9MK_001296, partial [Oceanospirillaceae bacterium]
HYRYLMYRHQALDAMIPKIVFFAGCFLPNMILILANSVV